MLFQTLDDKESCIAVYAEGQLIKELPDNLTRTWSYSSFLKNRDIEYAYLYSQGKKLNELVPASIEPQWKNINAKLKAFLRSFKLAKVSLEDNCFFDLVPVRFLTEYCELKNIITQHVFDIFPKPENYEFLVELTKVLADIKSKKLNIDLNSIQHKMHKPNIRALIRSVRKSNKCVDYDIFGTKTGRLTTKRKSFPVLTMNKECRSILKPKNDFFLELDYNAAEVRTILALLDIEQPTDDLHEVHRKEIFNGELSREETKIKTFEWLYNPVCKNDKLDGLYSKERILNEYWDGERITNPFNRVIESDRFHAVNTIMQSTFADIFLRQKIKINKYLCDKNSELVLSIHDCVLLDMTREEKDIIPELIKLFTKTDLGDFRVNVKMGKNFGEMKNCTI